MGRGLPAVVSLAVCNSSSALIRRRSEHVERDVEPEQQDDDGAKRSVKLIVVGEVRDVEREGR